TAATEAASSITRSYQDSNGHAISMHLALFDDPDRGVYHSPTNCYRAQGWARLGGRDVSLQVPGRPTIQVRLSTWQREGDKILVLYWYELGENVLFERIDMGAVRWKMRGRATWPPMVKVLLQTSAAEAGLAQSQLLQIAAQIRQWVGQMDPPASGDKNPQAGEQQ
ncbi:MAG: exosortase C-terminal domain/associated protein EpsI, partial [Thermoguttaceae bacterium]